MSDPRSGKRRERLLKWLQDAYAMEQEAETMMKAMASRIENYAELAARIGQHVQETRQQSESLRQCIQSLGGSVPTAKGLFASLTAAMHAAGNSMMEDEVVKGIGLSFGFENTEIATYRALVVAAERAGATDIAAVCGQILQEEIAMARWLEDHQDVLVSAFLDRDETPGAEAKR
ncbi:ferritin-like domain-containing protein [Xanthomonas retroflexus]|uniref:ferritin-like domain-containing protein n=1 Tax=Stenotrophomonas indicatrix TaxID=2045451 RepID=UPI000B450687